MNISSHEGSAFRCWCDAFLTIALNYVWFIKLSKNHFSHHCVSLISNGTSISVLLIFFLHVFFFLYHFRRILLLASISSFITKKSSYKTIIRSANNHIEIWYWAKVWIVLSFELTVSIKITIRTRTEVNYIRWNHSQEVVTLKSHLVCT